jgi:hypothetical protein
MIAKEKQHEKPGAILWANFIFAHFLVLSVLWPNPFRPIYIDCISIYFMYTLRGMCNEWVSRGGHCKG